MNSSPSIPSWPPPTPSWPEYFSPEQPRPVDDRGVRTAMAMWASAVLVAAVVVLVLLLWQIV